MLEVEALRAGYGGSEVLHSISLTVRDGERVALLGPNGHGKTTLLNTISGLITPYGGTVTFGGRRLTGLPSDQIVAAGVVHIPQGDLPFPSMTVLENLLMGAYVRSAWRERRRRLDEVFELFPGLAGRRHQAARTLSGGERRMLALGRGIMADARLLLIDEPSLGLAPTIIDAVYRMISRITGSGDRSLLLVEENAQRIDGLADRVYVLQSGAVVLEGEPRTLVSDPALLAAYLG
jgi:branched-chain amino acid transport system ATP-binding protein